MVYHRPPVVRDQDSAQAGCNLKYLGIWNPHDFAVRRGGEVNCRFSKPDGPNDALPDVGVGLESDQGRDSPILTLARWSLSQSPGFSSASEMLFPSNSRSVSSRYLSISAWWSK